MLNFVGVNLPGAVVHDKTHPLRNKSLLPIGRGCTPSSPQHPHFSALRVPRCPLTQGVWKLVFTICFLWRAARDGAKPKRGFGMSGMGGPHKALLHTAVSTTRHDSWNPSTVLESHHRWHTKRFAAQAVNK